MTKSLVIEVPAPHVPEYRLTLVWRSDADGNGIRTYLEHSSPDGALVRLQDGFHPTLDLQDAVESAMTQFFEERVK